MEEESLQNHYQFSLMCRKYWNEIEHFPMGFEFESVKKMIRFFVAFINSNIPGMALIVGSMFNSIIGWSRLNIETDLGRKLVTLFGETIFSEFYCTSDVSSQPRLYCSSKVNIRFLRVIIAGFGVEHALARLPLLYDYLVQALCFNYTAPVVKDTFISISKEISIRVRNDSDHVEHLVSRMRNFMLSKSHKLWFDTGSLDLQRIKFCEFVLPSLAACLPDRLSSILEEIEQQPEDSPSRDHHLLLWIYGRTALMSISKIKSQLLLLSQCLVHADDSIRQCAVQLACDHWPHVSCSLGRMLSILSHDLTSDSAALRNHFAGATRRLLRRVRDSLVPLLAATSGEEARETFLVNIMASLERHSDATETADFMELVNWQAVEHQIQLDDDSNSDAPDVVLMLLFSRHLFSCSWLHSSCNYQRQKSTSDLMEIVYELLIDPEFFIDKNSGFGKATVTGLRDFYGRLMTLALPSNCDIVLSLLRTIQQVKPDVQATLFRILTRLQHPQVTKELHDSLWPTAISLCHKTQPALHSAGAHLLAFLGTRSSDASVALVTCLTYIEDISQLSLDTVLDTALNQPGHGLLHALQIMLQQEQKYRLTDKQVGRLIETGITAINRMLVVMGCRSHNDDDVGMATFQDMGLSIARLTTDRNNGGDVFTEVELDSKYQHVLSWSWQTLRANAESLVTLLSNRCYGDLVSDCVHREVGLTLVYVMTHCRHRGTIESVGNCLRTYLGLGRSSLTCREVAMEMCIDNAVQGQHSVTRRSAGLPYILVAALTAGCHDCVVLTTEVVERLLELVGTDSGSQPSNEYICHDNAADAVEKDRPLIHRLNLLRVIIMEPSCLQAAARLHGAVTMAGLAQFRHPDWTVRNAALQLLVAAFSRLAGLAQGLHTCTSLSELCCLHPHLPGALLNTGTNHNTAGINPANQLVPALTLLSSLRASHPRHLPVSVQDIPTAILVPLLDSKVFTVRRLAATTIAQWSLNLPQIEEDITSALTGPLSSNGRHGRLLLLQQLAPGASVASANQIRVAVVGLVPNLVSRHDWLLLTEALRLLRILEEHHDHFSSPDIDELLNSALLDDMTFSRPYSLEASIAVRQRLHNSLSPEPTHVLSITDILQSAPTPSSLTALSLHQLSSRLCPTLAAWLVTHCYHEDRPIRDQCRALLLSLLPLSSSHNHLKLADIAVFIRLSVSQTSLFSVILTVWERLLEDVTVFSNQIRAGQQRDALYEPMPDNLYIEYSLLFDFLATMLASTQPATDDKERLEKLIERYHGTPHNLHSDFHTVIHVLDRSLHCLTNVLKRL